MEVWFYSFSLGCFYSISNKLDLEKNVTHLNHAWVCSAQPSFPPPCPAHLFVWKGITMLVSFFFFLAKIKGIDSVCEQKCMFSQVVGVSRKLEFLWLRNYFQENLFFFFVTLFIKYSNDCETISKSITEVRILLLLRRL